MRYREHLTQKQLAQALNMHLTQYRRYEHGDREPPFDFMIGLAKYYGVSLDYLAELTSNKNIEQ